MSAPGWHHPLARAGPSGPDAPEPAPCTETERYEQARAAGLTRPRPRCAARGPIYSRCPHCGEWAPEAQAFEHFDGGGDVLKLTGCLRCIAQQIEEVA